MKKLVVFSLIFLFQILFILKVPAQVKPRVFEVPPEYVSLLLVSDEKSPIQLSNSRFLKYEKGTFEKVYMIFNRSDRSVKSFQIKELSWLSDLEYTKDLTAQDNNSFLPYEGFSSLNDESKLEFIDFDETKAKSFKLFDHPRKVWIVMVTKVELWDGTTYDTTAEYREIEKFVKNLEVYSELTKSEIDNKESTLRNFINKIVSSKK